MKKKVVALFILAAMALTFAGCSNTKNVPINDTKDVPASNSEDAPNTHSDRADELAGPVIENLNGKVLVDSKDIKITAHEITFDEDISADVYLKISNGTDKDLYFQTRNESVNDCVVNGILSEIVEAGSEKDIPLWFTDRDLAMYGVAGIRKIEFNFYIFTTDTFEEYMTSAPVCIELQGNGDAVKVDTNENVLYEGNGIRIAELTDEKYVEDAFEYTAVVRVENNTGSEIIVLPDHADTEEVGGFVDLFAQVPAGKVNVVNATLRDMPDFSEIENEEEPAPVDEVHETKAPKTVTVSFTVVGADEPIHVENATLTMRRGC